MINHWEHATIWVLGCVLVLLGGCSGQNPSKPSPSESSSEVQYTAFRADNGLYGFRDPDGNVVVKPVYSMIGCDAGYGLIPVSKTAVYPLRGDTEDDWHDDGFDSDLRHADRMQARWGFIDETGKLVIPMRFLEVGPFHFGLARARHTNGKWGYINPQGTWAIKPDYLWVRNWDMGRETIEVWKSAGNDEIRKLLLDAKGNIVKDLGIQDEWF